MSNGSIVVGPQGIRRLDPAQIEAQAAGMEASNRLKSLQSGPGLARALSMTQAKMPGVSGRGAAAQAPSGWNALATVLEQRKGGKQLEAQQAAADELRGTISEGQRAGLQRQDDIAQLEFDYKSDLERQRTEREEAARRDEYARLDEDRENLEMIGPDMEKKTVQVDRQGRGYLDGKPINISEWTKANKGLGQQNLKPTGGQIKDYTEAHRLMGEMQSILDFQNTFTEDEKNELNSPIKEAAISMVPTKAGENLAKEISYRSDNVKDYKSRSELITSDLSKLAAGLALSGFEIGERQKWDPSAPGISLAEKNRRWSNIQRKFGGKIDAFDQYYPSFTMDKKYGSKDSGTTGASEAGIDEMSEEEVDAEIARLEAAAKEKSNNRALEKSRARAAQAKTYYY